MASNSRPSSSICSSVSRASGLSIIVSMLLLGRFVRSVVVLKLDLHRALGRVDTGADHLALAAGDLARPQVAHLARAQAPDAGVTDAHPAAEGQGGARLLAGHQDRSAPVRLRLDVALHQLDGPPGALSAVAADDRLEALDVHAVRVALALPVLDQSVEEVAGPGQEGLALAPVGAEIVEILGAHPPHLGRVLLVQAKAGTPARQLAQLVTEDDLVGRGRGVQDDDVVELVAPVQLAQHAHDRRDAAAGTD